MSQHTPGPWYHTASAPEGTVFSDLHELIVPYGPSGATERTHADARLLASAPELLAALRAIVVVMDGSQPKDYTGALMVARAAIRRAEEG